MLTFILYVRIYPVKGIQIIYGYLVPYRRRGQVGLSPTLCQSGDVSKYSGNFQHQTAKYNRDGFYSLTYLNKMLHIYPVFPPVNEIVVQTFSVIQLPVEPVRR